MKDNSLMVGRIHFLMLAANLTVCVLLLLTNSVYYYRTDLFYMHLSQLDLTVTAMNKSFFILVHLSFLVWMYQVHSTINRMKSNYAISESDFLVQMLPVVQLWGIGAVLAQIRTLFREHPLLQRRSDRLKAFIPLIYISYLASWAGYYVMHQSGGISMEATLVVSVIFVVMNMVYMSALHLISQGVYVMMAQPVVDEPPQLAPDLSHAEREDTDLQEVLPDLPLAARGIRLAASLIDSVIFMIAVSIGLMIGAMAPEDDTDFFMILFALLAMLLYMVLYALHVSWTGQSLGKQLLGIRIVRLETGQSGGFLYNFFLRSFVNGIIGGFVPAYSLVDYCFIFSSDRRCLHDRLAGTIVINERRAAAARRELDEAAGSYRTEA